MGAAPAETIRRPPATPGLPIEAVLPEVRRALGRGRALVLQAPPGAGKTTCVPLALLDEPWLGAGRIVLLEPRRLAARAAAARMAALLGEAVGETVGYRIRLDSKVGPRTRIEVVTEGILTRRLQSDPALSGVGAVLFDEFHERSLHADLGLALCLEAQAALRPDLRLVAMSATLDGEPVARLMGGAPVVTGVGRAHAVETRYAEPAPGRRFEDHVAATARRALAEAADGDVLVFLPGEAEIRRVLARLEECGLGPEVLLAPLFGALPRTAQDAALAPAPPGRRKVVLATAIAETSLTIEGVRVVVDGGLARAPRFDPRTGMTRLETVRVSQASADQRRGRAGRLGPGVCYRLWREAEHRLLPPFSPPEIVQADLAPLALELAAWGAADPADLAWLDPPPAAAFAQACGLLPWLGAGDGAGGVGGVAEEDAVEVVDVVVESVVVRVGGSVAVGVALVALGSPSEERAGGGVGVELAREDVVAGHVCGGLAELGGHEHGAGGVGRPGVLVAEGGDGVDHGEDADGEDDQREGDLDEGEAASLGVADPSHGASGGRREGGRVAWEEGSDQPTIWLILKMGRMIAMAMKPTIEPITMIMMGSIIPVTALTAERSWAA